MGPGGSNKSLEEEESTVDYIDADSFEIQLNPCEKRNGEGRWCNRIKKWNVFSLNPATICVSAKILGDSGSFSSELCQEEKIQSQWK